MEELEITERADEPLNEETENSEKEESALPDESLNDGDDAEAAENAIDYEELEKADMEELRSLFPHLRDKTRITELDNPLRYAALRDLGLTPKEAYLATSEPMRKYDNRSHLRSSVPKSASAPADILTRGELEAARELFSGLSDREIQKLYKKVSR